LQLAARKLPASNKPERAADSERPLFRGGRSQSATPNEPQQTVCGRLFLASANPAARRPLELESGPVCGPSEALFSFCLSLFLFLSWLDTGEWGKCKIVASLGGGAAA